MGHVRDGAVRIIVSSMSINFDSNVSSDRDWWLIARVCASVIGGLSLGRILIYLIELWIPRFLWFVANTATAVFGQ